MVNFYPILLGALSRWHGSSIAGPKVLNSLVYGGSYMAYFLSLEPTGYKAAAFVLLGTAAMKSSANEAFHVVDHPEIEQRPSWLTMLTCSLLPRTPTRTWKWCIAGMTVQGYLTAIPLYTSLVIFSYHPEQAMSVLFAGSVSEACAYLAGRKLNGKFGLLWTQWGELLTGVIAGLGFLS